jgi:hypothetical protein
VRGKIIMVLSAAALELAIAAQGRPRQIAAEPFPETFAARSSWRLGDFERDAGTDSGRWRRAAPKSGRAAPNSVSKRAHARYFENDPRRASVFAVALCVSERLYCGCLFTLTARVPASFCSLVP